MRTDGPGEERLPRGRHPLSASEVQANQRLRLIAAAAALVAERGVVGVNAREVARRAGVSSSTLYALFSGSDAVLAAGAESAAISALEAAREACAGTREDEQRLLDAAVAACEWAARNDAMAGLLGLSPAVAIGDIAASRERLIEELSRSLARVQGNRMARGDPEVRMLMISAAVTLVSERAGAMGLEEARALGAELADLVA